MFRIIISCTTLALLSLSTPASADKIYRWVDDSGQTHFSSQPPADKRQGANEYQPNYSTHKADPMAPQYRAQEKTNPVDEKTQKAAEPDTTAQCEEAKSYKAALTSGEAARFRGADGKVTTYSEEKRLSELKRADQLIARFCK